MSHAELHIRSRWHRRPSQCENATQRSKQIGTDLTCACNPKLKGLPLVDDQLIFKTYLQAGKNGQQAVLTDPDLVRLLDTISWTAGHRKPQTIGLKWKQTCNCCHKKIIIKRNFAYIRPGVHVREQHFGICFWSYEERHTASQLASKNNKITAISF